MGALFVRLVLLLVGFLGILGPLILLMGSLRLRDQQESIVLGEVLKELNSPDLRGLFAVNVKCGLFSGQGTVTIDLQGCSKEQVIDVIIRLSSRVSSKVQLVVNGITDSRSRSALTLNVKRSFLSTPSVSCCR